jgi:hypothetical protein
VDRGTAFSGFAFTGLVFAGLAFGGFGFADLFVAFAFAGTLAFDFLFLMARIYRRHGRS